MDDKLREYMWMSKVIIFFGILLSAGTSFGSSVYFDIFEQRSVEIGLREVRLTDVAYDANPCARHEDFVCIRSKAFNFGIPKNFSSVTEWFFEGERYKVIEFRHTMWFGKRVKYAVIAVSGKSEILYAYSISLGVLAIKNVASGHVLVLGGRCGFGSLIKTRNC